MMKSTEFVAKLKDAATNHKTLYVMGCFGAPMTEANKQRYINHHSYNARADRKPYIVAATADTFGFDCVCLIKGILWGWNADKTKAYGGAGYAINGVPDIGADAMITKCSGISTNFAEIVPGEAVWMRGHIGVYIGDGLAVECTPAWENKVQITACNCSKAGYNRRNWTKHGKLPYIEYVTEEKPAEPVVQPTNGTLAVGDTVTFTGNTHYTSSYPTAAGKPAKACTAKITAMRKAGVHPYHLIGSGVYGWVNTSDIKEANTATGFAVGDKVKCNAGVTKYSNGTKMASWVPSATLYVRKVEQGGKVLLVSTEPVKAVYTGRVNASDVHKI